MLLQSERLGFSNARVGGHSARSMMFLEMRALVRTLPLNVTKADFVRAIVEENALEKPTQSSRKKSLRHLIELYGMDPSQALFRVLWEFGHADLDSLPQLCLVCSYSRDPQLRHSFELVRKLRLGEVLGRRLSRPVQSGHEEVDGPKRKYHLDVWWPPDRQSEKGSMPTRATPIFRCLCHVCRLSDRPSRNAAAGLRLCGTGRLESAAIAIGARPGLGAWVAIAKASRGRCGI